MAPTIDQLRGCSLFQDFSDDELRRVVPLLAERTVAPGTLLVAEGDPATELFIVCDGLVEVTKRAPGASYDHRLTTLGAGTTFGEMTLIDRAPRSASVRALAPTSVAVLRMQDLDGATERDPALRTRMLRNLSLYLAGRLRGVSEVTVAALENELALARTRVAMGTFLTYVIFMMVAYSFGLRVVSDLVRSSADSTLVSIPMILGFAVPLYLMMRRSGEPIATYGLTWKGAGAGARDGVLWSLPIIVAATLLKLAAVRRVPSLAEVPVFSLGGFLDPQVPVATAWFTLVMSVGYAAVVPIQEFVARGALQSSLQRFLVGPRATLLAVAIANALFVASHLYLSATFALIAMVPGFVWGALYARHGTLVAPIVSHALIGWWAFFVLGFDRLLV